MSCSDNDPNKDCRIIIQKVYWHDIGDYGVDIILEDDEGNKLTSSLKSDMVMEVVNLLLKAIGEKYEYEKKED